MPSAPTSSLSGTKRADLELPAAPKRKHRKTNTGTGTTGTTDVPAGLSLLLLNIEKIQNTIINDNAERRRRDFTGVVADFYRNIRDPSTSSTQRANYEVDFRTKLDAIKSYLEDRGFRRFNMNTHEYTTNEIESIIKENRVSTSESIRPHTTNTTNPPTAASIKEETVDHGATTGSTVAGPRKTLGSIRSRSMKATVVSANAVSSSSDRKHIVTIDSGAPELVKNIKNILDIIAKIEPKIDEDPNNFQKSYEEVNEKFEGALASVLLLKAKREVEGYELRTDKRKALEDEIHRKNRLLSRLRKEYATIFYDFLICLEEEKQSPPSLKDEEYSVDQINNLLSDTGIVQAFKNARTQAGLNRHRDKARGAFRLTGHLKGRNGKLEPPEDKKKVTKDA